MTGKFHLLIEIFPSVPNGLYSSAGMEICIEKGKINALKPV